MLLIVDGRQMIYDEIEALTATYRQMGGKVAVVLPATIQKANYEVDQYATLVEETLECRCKLYKFLMEQASVGPEDTTIISNVGQDLAAAVLIGCDFTFAMDYA